MSTPVFYCCIKTWYHEPVINYVKLNLFLWYEKKKGTAELICLWSGKENQKPVYTDLTRKLSSVQFGGNKYSNIFFSDIMKTCIGLENDR